MVKLRMPIETAIKKAKEFYHSAAGKEWVQMTTTRQGLNLHGLPPELANLPLSVFRSFVRSWPEDRYIKRAALQNFRQENNLSHKKLAELLGVKPKQVMRWLSPSKKKDDFVPIDFATFLSLRLSAYRVLKDSCSYESYTIEDENGKKHFIIKKIN